MELAKPATLVQEYYDDVDSQAVDPFGAVLWPGAHLAARTLLRHRDRVQGKTVACLGVGTGLEALTAAVIGARRVLAYDVSELALSLYYNVVLASYRVQYTATTALLKQYHRGFGAGYLLQLTRPAPWCRFISWFLQ